MAQLGNRVQHNLRAYTPAEQKIVKAVANSYRANPNFNTEEAILNLGTGEAIISFVNENGEPSVVEKATILPPQSQMGSLDDSMRLMIIARSQFKGKYDTVVDNISAYEILSEEINKKKEEEEAEKQAKEETKRQAEEQKELERQQRAEERAKREEERQKKAKEKEKEIARKNSASYKVGKAVEKTANSALSSMGRKIGNQIIKSLFKF